MKMLLLSLILLLPLSLYAQFDDLLKKTAIPDMLEEKNITTSIDDAYPVAFWLDDLEADNTPIEPADYSFNLAPGYYKFKIQSYCLHAGTYGPTEGAGHLIAPIKGKQADLVINILTRSADHPEIKQQDIQLLLWSIVDGVKFTDLEPGLQMRVNPLMTSSEIADMSIGIKEIPIDLLPDDLKQTARAYKELRDKLTNPLSSFEEIERAAVIPGDPPSKYLKKKVAPGNWSYAGNGFYMRIMPEHYSRSILEVYRPGMVNISRDDLKRITSIERDGYKTEIAYQDEPGSDILLADGKYYPVYRFKSIRYTGPDADEDFTTDNPGWMIRGDGKEIKNAALYKSYPQDPALSEYQARLNETNEFFKKIAKYKKDSNNPGKGSEMGSAEDFNADKHFSDGMRKALNPEDLKGKQKWIDKNIKHTMSWWKCASSVLAGGSCDDNNEPKKFNPEKHVGAPGNTHGQRIAPSKRQG